MRYLAQIFGDLKVIIPIGGFFVFVTMCWSKEPWFLKMIRPRKLRKFAQDNIRAFNKVQSCPNAFDPEINPLYSHPETQHLTPAEIELIATAVANHIKPKEEIKQ
jgi:hypothetical protein